MDKSDNGLHGELINCTTDGEAVIVNNARSFTDQGVKVLNSDYFKTQSLSVEMILKLDPTAMSGDHRLIFKDLVFDIHIWVDGTTPKIIPMLVTAEHGWGDIVLIECPELFDGEYHHIGFIYDGSTGDFTFYIDYVESATATLGGSVSSNANDLYIGAAYWAGALQQGSDATIKNVRLHNHSIEVSDFLGYNERAMLILDYDFNFVDGNMVLDQSGNEINGEIINCSVTDGALVVNNARSSSNQGVKVLDNPLFETSSMTVEMIVKMDPTAMSGDHRLIFKDLVFDMHIWVDGATPKLIPMLGTSSANWSDLTLYDCTSIFDGNFHHLAFTYDGETGIWILYVDHSQVATGVVGGDVKVNTNDLYIGAAYWAGAFQQGSDAEFKRVRIANYVIASSNFIDLP